MTRIGTGRRKYDWWFRKITPDTAKNAIRDLSTSWYVLAAVQSVIATVQLLAGAGLSANILDPIGCAVGGYFLGRRKSRVLAAALLVYALGLLAMTILARIGAVDGGRNVVLAVVVVFMGWRGVQATRVYALGKGLRIRWRHVIAIWGASLVAAAIVTFIAAVIWHVFSFEGGDDLAGLVIVTPPIIVFAVMIGTLSIAFPFEAHVPVSRDIPPNGLPNA